METTSNARHRTKCLARNTRCETFNARRRVTRQTRLSVRRFRAPDHPLCEPILTQHVIHTRQPANSGRPTTHFVSQSSQSGCLRAGRGLVRRLWVPLCERILTKCGAWDVWRVDFSVAKCALCEPIPTRRAPASREPLHSDAGQPRLTQQAKRTGCCTGRRRNHPCRAVPDACRVR